jgi:hypothetical protein
MNLESEQQATYPDDCHHDCRSSILSARRRLWVLPDPRDEVAADHHREQQDEGPRKSLIVQPSISIVTFHPRLEAPAVLWRRVCDTPHR